MASLCENPNGYGLVRHAICARFDHEHPPGDALRVRDIQCDFFCERGLVTLGDFVFNRASESPAGDLAFVGRENIQFKRPKVVFQECLGTHEVA